jgi:hypothetical protein
MKALLRTSLVGLTVFAGFAAFTTNISKPQTNAAIPAPRPCPLPQFSK